MALWIGQKCPLHMDGGILFEAGIWRGVGCRIQNKSNLAHLHFYFALYNPMDPLSAKWKWNLCLVFIISGFQFEYVWQFTREHCVFLWFPTFRQDNSYPFSFSCSVDLRKFAKDGFLCRGHAVTSDKLHNNNNGYCAENEKRDKKGRKTMSSMPWAEHKKPFLCWKKSISRMRDRNRGAMHAFAHVL